MAHLVGERFGCDECGAEIVFVKACLCPESEQKAHSDICCGKQMRNLGVASTTEAPQPEAGH
jgi:hypothetical protein